MHYGILKTMERFFNTTGPCNPEDHYMLPPEERLVRAQLDRYISQKLYWVLHAPRQTGKTTFLTSWMHKINQSKQAIACYVSIERCQGFTDIEQSMQGIASAIIEYAGLFLPPQYIPKTIQIDPASLVSAMLVQWAGLVAPLPLVVLFDEVDVLEDQAMISFLRQLRGGFAGRGVGKFPVSIALVGMRDLRDYIVHAKDGQLVRPGSPFNVKEDSASLGNFDFEDGQRLVQQHIQDTGQVIEPQAIQHVWDLAKGQPWLTNAICKKCTWVICPNHETVTKDHVEQAKELLIQERAVHLDSLSERLRDPKVKKIVQLILTGETDPSLIRGDNFRLTQDLGLVSLENGTPVISNPIYQEVVARVLSEEYQLSIPAIEFVWKKPDGTLDMDTLLKEFQIFWRRNSDIWETKSDYPEAFPHLVLMAFFQRVVNGGGRIEREYAAGRGRMDLAIQFAGTWNIIEIKLVHPADGLETTIEHGIKQILGYRNTWDSTAASYLVVFDRTPAGRARSWDERLFWHRKQTPQGLVTVVGG